MWTNLDGDPDVDNPVIMPMSSTTLSIGYAALA
jgi:hypothetical protein